MTSLTEENNINEKFNNEKFNDEILNSLLESPRSSPDIFKNYILWRDIFLEKIKVNSVAYNIYNELFEKNKKNFFVNILLYYYKNTDDGFVRKHIFKNTILSKRKEVDSLSETEIFHIIAESYLEISLRPETDKYEHHKILRKLNLIDNTSRTFDDL